MAQPRSGAAVFGGVVTTLLLGTSPAMSQTAASQPAVAGPMITGGARWGDQRLANRGPGEGVVTKGELMALSPQQAGDRMLGQLAHGPVAKVTFFDNFGPVKLMEEWTPVAEGCQRLDWTGQFLLTPGASAESAWLSQAFAFGQIAMAGPDGCASARYALLGVGVDRDTGFKALTLLEEVATGKRAATFDCKSPAGRDICNSPQAIKAELLRPVHRLIHKIGDRMALTYNSRGFGGALMYMTVTFDLQRPDQMKVEDIPFPAENRNGPPPLPLPPPPLPPSMLIAQRGAAPAQPPKPRPSAEGAKAYFEEKDNEKAIRLLTPPAEQGDALSLYYLTLPYLRPNGTAEETAKGMIYLRRAAEAGDESPYGGSTVSGTAMERLASIYENGMYGVPRDNEEAAKWWRLWAKTGDPRAGLVLAQRNIQP